MRFTALAEASCPQQKRSVISDTALISKKVNKNTREKAFFTRPRLTLGTRKFPELNCQNIPELFL